MDLMTVLEAQDFGWFNRYDWYHSSVVMNAADHWEDWITRKVNPASPMYPGVWEQLSQSALAWKQQAEAGTLSRENLAKAWQYLKPYWVPGPGLQQVPSVCWKSAQITMLFSTPGLEQPLKEFTTALGMNTYWGGWVGDVNGVRIEI